MLILTNGDTLQVVLLGAVTTDQPEFMASWADDGASESMGNTTGETNSTTPVTLVAGPAASTYRVIRSIAIHNRDTVAAGVVVQINDGVNTRRVFAATVNPGKALTYGDDGWREAVQPYSARLEDIGDLAATDGNVIVGNGSTWVAESGATARTSLGFTDPILDKASPGAIGGGTPSTGAFTALTFSASLTGSAGANLTMGSGSTLAAQALTATGLGLSGGDITGLGVIYAQNTVDGLAMYGGTAFNNGPGVVFSGKDNTNPTYADTIQFYTNGFAEKFRITASELLLLSGVNLTMGSGSTLAAQALTATSVVVGSGSTTVETTSLGITLDRADTTTFQGLKFETGSTRYWNIDMRGDGNNDLHINPQGSTDAMVFTTTNVEIPKTLDSTSTSTGALVVDGGVGIAKTIRAGGPVVAGTYTVATLPSAAAYQWGWAAVSNGRKTGEGAGAGTGLLVYSDGTNWIRPADDTTVAA